MPQRLLSGLLSGHLLFRHRVCVHTFWVFLLVGSLLQCTGFFWLRGAGSILERQCAGLFWLRGAGSILERQSVGFFGLRGVGGHP